MEIAGIVCEYNPFHNGHAFHIRKSRELLGEDGAVLCVMSGDFVQRGEAACYSKFARAEAACRSGADLVVELPLPWSLSSAEGFARGAVGLLGALGATKLCFGSESGELAPLDALAQSLLQPGLINEIKDRLSGDGNLSFAAARELAVRARLGAAADLLRQPNDILAVEYLKAVYELRLDLEPVPILRQGCAHDQSGGPGQRSASEIRKRIAAGKALDQDMPLSALSVLMKERELGREIRDRSVYETALLSRLRLFDEAYFNRLPGAADGLGNRMFRAVREEAGYDAVLAAAKTKRFALSRIRRLALCACLGVTDGASDGVPPYARILAFNPRGRELLRYIGSRSPVPLVTKPAAVHQLSPACEKLFTLCANAHDFYVLGYPAKPERRPGTDWKSGPKVVDAEEKSR